MALRQLVERADSGDPKSIYDLAVLHDTGYDSISVDSVRSTALYRLSAEKGYSPARNYLGFRYYNGQSVRRDVDSALYWIGLAAGSGDVKAAGNIGYLLSQSNDVPHDYGQAFKWLQYAADAGLPAAQSNLGDMFRLGLGCNPDTIRAQSFYEEAMRKGMRDAELKLLAMMGNKWAALEPDSALYKGLEYYNSGATIAGIDLIEKAASRGNPKALALMGDFYSRGEGVVYDYNKSVEYFIEAAFLGNPSAQFVVAELLEIFPDALKEESLQKRLMEIIPPEFTEETVNDPRFWYEKAALQGVTNAEEATVSLFSIINLQN